MQYVCTYGQSIVSVCLPIACIKMSLTWRKVYERTNTEVNERLPDMTLT